ncbi:MAG TPA: cyclopropane-fatty-acyl-phospholipid synthase family protein [Noviherbaspirillum sp.]
MFWERKLGNWADEVRGRCNLPLRVELWNGQQLDLGTGTTPEVTVRVPHASALSYLLTPSLYNLGRAYVEGAIDIEGRPTSIISVGSELARTLKPEGRFGRMVRTFQHSRKMDEEAIRYHYDVSNAFYQVWLDKNMVYSCAYFENGAEDLDAAQLKKIDHILNKIQLRPGQSLLDIGCGWGALVLRAAEKYGVRCVGITLSQNQYELATERVQRAGLADRVEIRLQDYRDVSGRFDRITSVGMFEHVGAKHLVEYFSRMRMLLADGGLAMNHGITTTDPKNGETAYGGGEFIHRYVFPHGELEHLGTVLLAMQEGGLEAFDIENLRRHYAQTCATWAENYEANAAKIKTLVDDKRFRIWRVYLAGCAYAFSQDWISLYQVVCTKAGADATLLPRSRRYMYS